VCIGEYAQFVKVSPEQDRYISATSVETSDGVRPHPSVAEPGITVKRIELREADTATPNYRQDTVHVPQQGPAPAPLTDVFGRWSITGASSVGWGPVKDPRKEDFPTPELLKQCADSMPQNEAQRVEMMTGYKPAPPAHGAAEPGWPSNPN
jgi:hypothetical protein